MKDQPNLTEDSTTEGDIQVDVLGGCKRCNDNSRKASRLGMRNQILTTFVILILAAGCGMPIGYSAVLLPQLYNTSDALQMDLQMGSWFASIHSLATPLGSFVSGTIADKLGRRSALMLSTIPIVAGWIVIATACSHTWLIIGRVSTGIAVGSIGPPAQVLIAETTEPYLRSILIGTPFIAYSAGILLVYILGSKLHWRIVAWLGTFLPLVGMLGLCLIHESPIWLARVGKLDRATHSLNFLRGNEAIAELELNELRIRFKVEKSRSDSESCITQRAKCLKSVLSPLIIINVFNILQIFSGTFLVVFYAVDIISELGSYHDSMSATVMTGVVRVICAIIFCILSTKIRRRTMALTSGVGSGLSAVILGAFMMFKGSKTKSILNSYVSGTFIFSYIAFNTGFMILPGIMIGELIPANLRGSIAGYIFAGSNIMLFSLTKVFPYLQVLLGTGGLFLMFGTASFAAALLIFLMLPETKFMTLTQIEDYFQSGNWLWVFRHKSFKPSKS